MTHRRTRVTHRTRVTRHTHRTRFAVLAAVVVLALGGLLAAPAGAAQAPRSKDPSATGRKLSTEFLTILQQGDTAALAKFLDPVFQLQRADGTGVNKAEYVANPAVVGQFQLGDTVTATQHGDVLVVRWSLKSDLSVDGQQYTGAEAPRLSTYRWSGKRWRLASHANFNKPA